MKETIDAVSTSLLKEVKQGLSAPQKHISSMFLYDEKGDQIFQQIMELEEYYLTRSEMEILLFQSQKILKHIKAKEFDLIELGSGDGVKTKVLIDKLMEAECDFSYNPIDISLHSLEELTGKLLRQYPSLDINPINTDYFKALDTFEDNPERPKVVLFLGSNIGNLSKAEALDFLLKMREKLHPNDILALGVDLKKNPITIANAYNDRLGITKSFNLNLLKRLNKEMGANFDVSAFDHYPHYDPVTGIAYSYLVSLKDQEVYFEALETTFQFKKNELIHTEISKKYGMEEIEKMLTIAGFKHEEHLLDNVWNYSIALFTVPAS